MKKYKIIFLTDENKHTINNSFYSLANEFLKSEKVDYIDIASRGNIENSLFFNEMSSDELFVKRINIPIFFTENRNQFDENSFKSHLYDYDVVMMRLARPISDELLLYIKKSGKGKVIFINDPEGIIITSNKKFILNFPELSTEMKLCKNTVDVINISKKYPIVLKPLKGYGGQGIVRIDKGVVFNFENKKIDFDTYIKSMEFDLKNDGFIAMKYLKNVKQGDKRILVVNGKILAASIRLPKKESWICNVASGGKSIFSIIEEEEMGYVNYLYNVLKNKGIIVFGLDTLVDDNGKRVVSEINTLSIGGFPQAEEQMGKPILKETIDLIFDYIEEVFNA
jgi:glutathione synthase